MKRELNLSLLQSEPVLEVKIPGLETLIGGKVSDGFKLHDGNLLFVATDRIGAYDQPHKTTAGLPAHYPGKGIVTTALSEFNKKRVIYFMPTDYLPVENYPEIPEELRTRSSIHIPAKKRIKVEFIVRSSCEGGLKKNAEKGEPICGQALPKDIRFGFMLPRPYFTPTTKAPKGQKDQNLMIEEYFNEVGDKDLANYLMGMTILLHLHNRVFGRHTAHIDLTDEKMEFGIFQKGLPIYRKQVTDPLQRQNVPSSEFHVYFAQFLAQSHFPFKCSWTDFPGFDFDSFVKFAAANLISGEVRLIDEYANTDTGRMRLLMHTQLGQEFAKAGLADLANQQFNAYLCKQYFRLNSEKTGQGGYEKSASQEVVVSDEVLMETGRRNIFVTNEWIR